MEVNCRIGCGLQLGEAQTIHFDRGFAPDLDILDRRGKHDPERLNTFTNLDVQSLSYDDEREELSLADLESVQSLTTSCVFGVTLLLVRQCLITAFRHGPR